MERDESVRMYYEMVLIRKLEERAAELYQEGRIGGFLHLYIGEEAVGVGVVSARENGDRVITAYRDHGVAIACGLESRVVMAELLGKQTGCSKGRGGSMHMADVSKNFWGGHAIVGSHLPVATGLALGDKYSGRAGVTICLFGDGATNIGYFHEALNLSKVWSLPVLWICENNKYGMGTSVERASAVSEIRQKAAGYDIASARVDGMDVVAVQEATLGALKEIRAAGGPRFLEAVTYRYKGHSMGDPERYRQPEEIRQWEENDPIGIFRKYLTGKKIASKTELDESDRKAEAELQEAVAFAEASPDPAPEDLFDDLYVQAQGLSS
ncbi:MAG: pyruvate dehydrogenase (acetyl-transferring) E1 component subunit alpha [Anaerolineales bacterium]|jgi:pyruvate dehydrogenase E1 component alpha subunit